MAVGLWAPRWSARRPFAYFFFLGFLTSLLLYPCFLPYPQLYPANGHDAMRHRRRHQASGSRPHCSRTNFCNSLVVGPSARSAVPRPWWIAAPAGLHHALQPGLGRAGRRIVPSPDNADLGEQVARDANLRDRTWRPRPRIRYSCKRSKWTAYFVPSRNRRCTVPDFSIFQIAHPSPTRFLPAAGRSEILAWCRAGGIATAGAPAVIAATPASPPAIV